jgi:hypothetical protein
VATRITCLSPFHLVHLDPAKAKQQYFDSAKHAADTERTMPTARVDRGASDRGLSVRTDFRVVLFLFLLANSIPAPAVYAEGAVEGRVVDVAGNPVQGLAVTAVDMDDCRRCFKTETDGGGKYVFPTLPDGIYCVSVREDRSCVAGKSDIVVTRDATAEQDFRLSGGEIWGKVMDETGAPIPGAKVSANAPGHRHFTETSKDGSYLLRRLQPGDYTLSARSDAHPEMKTEPVLIAEPTSVVSGVDIVLPPGGRVRGHISGPDGESIAEAKITLRGDSDSGEREYVFGKSSKDGTYALPAARTGTCDIAFGAKGLAFQRVEEVRVVAGKETVVNATLSPPAAIEGIVRSAVTGKPVADATVEADPADDGRWFPWYLDEVITSSTGYYRLSGELPGGIFEVSVEPPTKDLLPAKVEPVITRSGETTTGIDLELPPSSSISGTVRDTTGNPAEGVRLGALEEDRRPGWGPVPFYLRHAPSAVTDASGRFRIPGVAPGPYCLTLLPEYKNPLDEPPPLGYRGGGKRSGGRGRGNSGKGNGQHQRNGAFGPHG